MKRHTTTVLRTNLSSIIKFELLYKIFIAFLMSPLLILLFKLSLWTSNVEYLAGDTMRAVLTNPIVYILLIVTLLLLAFTNLIELFGTIIAIHESANHRPMSATQIFHAGIVKAKEVTRIKNWGLILFVILILPFVQILPMAGIVSSISIPGFIMDFIKGNQTLLILCSAVFLILILFSLQRIFLLHAYVLGDGNLKAAYQKSKQLIRRKRAKTLLGIVWNLLILTAVFFVIGTILSLLAMLIIQFTVSPEGRHLAALLTVNAIVIAVSAVYGFFAPMIGFYIIGEYYYINCEKEQLPSETGKLPHTDITKRERLITVSVPCALLAVSVLSTILSPSFLDTIDRTKVVVAGHRGYSANAPENSMPAYEAAIAVGCKWIELDVHQTKDGAIVITHDDNIERIAGVDKYVYDMTLDEIQTYDVGSWFSPKFSDLRVITLDDVLKQLKGRVKIQIELKPTGHEKNFEQHVIDIVRANGFEKDCLLGSLNADCIKKVKQLAPDLQTLYIMTAALGNLEHIDFADCFSLEETNIDEETIAHIHNADKLCYVWTINSEDNVENLVEEGIDGILTDDPEMVQDTIDRCGINKALLFVLDKIYE